MSHKHHAKNHAKQDEPVKMTRREFIKNMFWLGGAAVLASTGVYGAIKYFEKSANDYADEFPDSIPGAAKVQKCKTSDAAHCLVHIGQIHDSDLQSREQIKYLTDVQRDIYSILSYLIAYRSLREVYFEGLTEDLDLSKKLKGPYVAAGFDESNPDAGLQLSAEGKLFLKATETVEANDRSTASIEEFEKRLDTLKTPLNVPDDPKEAVEYLKEKQEEMENIEKSIYEIKQRTFLERENMLMQKITENDDLFAVAIYGVGHSLSDSMQKWNETYRNDRFSLIRIIPQSVKGY